MMPLSNKKHRARKIHRCDMCYGQIKPGQTYHSKAFVAEYGFDICKTHDYCERLIKVGFKFFDHEWFDGWWPYDCWEKEQHRVFARELTFTYLRIRWNHCRWLIRSGLFWRTLKFRFLLRPLRKMGVVR